MRIRNFPLPENAPKYPYIWHFTVFRRDLFVEFVKVVRSMSPLLHFFVLFVFQGEGNSNENFFLRIVKLVLNIIAVLVLAGVISVVIKVFNYYHNNDF